MKYTINFSKQAFKELGKVSEPYYSMIKLTINNLSENPRPKGYKKLKAREGYRIRVSHFRVIYSIKDSELIVEIIALGHRKEIYN